MLCACPLRPFTCFHLPETFHLFGCVIEQWEFPLAHLLKPLLLGNEVLKHTVASFVPREELLVC